MSDTTQKYITIQQPTFLSPSQDSNGAVDLSKNTNFSCVVNGSYMDAYEIKIRDTNNNLVYDSGSSTSIPNTSSSIQFNGSWNTESNQYIDDTNSQVNYYGYGWSTYANNSYGYYNNAIHHSSTANDYATLNFQGTGINCYFTTGSNMGTATIYMDGVDVGTIDLYASTGTLYGYTMQVLKYSNTTLSYGTHTIKILVTGNKNGASNGSVVELDYFQILNTSGAKISNATNDNIQYTFNSSGIEIYMDQTPDSGIVDILIDNVDMGTTDLYSSTYNLDQLVYSNYNLSTGLHTIKINITGNKNSQSTGANARFQSFTIVNKTPLPTPLEDGDTFSVTIPANTITYRGALKWQLSLWNSTNNGEMVSSSEVGFLNMSTPVIGFNIPSIINSKQTEFDATYTQAENIIVKDWTMNLYAINYDVNEQYFGMAYGGTDAKTIDCGYFGDAVTSDGITVDEGTF